MPGLRPDIDPDGLLEYSVVFTDRSLNHMSQAFQHVMREIHATLCEVYDAHRAVVVPGGGTYAMESVARQFATGKKAAGDPQRLLLVPLDADLRGRLDPGRRDRDEGAAAGRWAQTRRSLPRRSRGGRRIHADRPDVVFAPHVETASGIILPDDYLRAVADAAHEVGALFVLDCVASGASGSTWPRPASTC